MACVQMKPYLNILQDKSQFVEIIAPYSKNQIIPNLVIPSNISTLNQLNNLQNISWFNRQDIKMNKSSSTLNYINDILILLSFGLSVTSLVFYSLVLNIFINSPFIRDHYREFFITLIVCYSIVMFFRFIYHFLICFRQQMSFSQRVSFALSFLCPLLKYRMIKTKSKEFRFNLKITLITDGISTFFILLAGIIGLISYQISTICLNWTYCQNYLFTGIFFVVEVFFQILGYWLYRNFFEEKLNQQKYVNNKLLHRKPDIENTTNGYLNPQESKQLYKQNRQNGVLQIPTESENLYGQKY